MKIAKKISLGTINGVRGGFKDVKEKTRVATIAGTVMGYKEKTSETMGVSYAFSGDFVGINKDGEETRSPVCYLPEPAQGMLKAQVDQLEREGINAAVEFAFDFFAVPDETAIKGYIFETVPRLKAKPSNALAAIAQAAGINLENSAPQLTHEPAAPETEQAEEAPAHKGKGKGK
jgi:hypothetical protein